jgi:hypothetical protein
MDDAYQWREAGKLRRWLQVEGDGDGEEARGGRPGAMKVTLVLFTVTGYAHTNSFTLLLTRYHTSLLRPMSHPITRSDLCAQKTKHGNKIEAGLFFFFFFTRSLLWP